MQSICLTLFCFQVVSNLTRCPTRLPTKTEAFTIHSQTIEHKWDVSHLKSLSFPVGYDNPTSGNLTIVGIYRMSKTGAHHHVGGYFPDTSHKYTHVICVWDRPPYQLIGCIMVVFVSTILLITMSYLGWRWHEGRTRLFTLV